VLQSGALRLRLETPLDLPLGARLALVLPQGLPPPGPAQPPPAGDPLQRLLAALLQQESSGGAAHAAGGLRLPAADHALAARLLGWLRTLAVAAALPAGESADAGEPEPAGDPVRAATLELARQAREPLPGGWRVLVMPIGVEDPQILRIHLRAPAADPDPEHDAPAGREREAAAQRAVFELELSHLGRCQLDVLCRAERFDLVVRSAAPLGPAVEDEIRSLIAATRATAGLTGRLEFRPAELLALPDPSLPAGSQITI
jgi:hypothetical protein